MKLQPVSGLQECRTFSGLDKCAQRLVITEEKVFWYEKALPEPGTLDAGLRDREETSPPVLGKEAEVGNNTGPAVCRAFALSLVT